MIGLKQNSNGTSGVVWVRTTGTNQHGEVVLDYVRWVMVRKRDADAPAPQTVVPDLAPSVAAGDLMVPEGLDFTGYDFAAGRRAASLGATTRSARRSTMSTGSP